jgi:hypothetical protein
MSGESNRKQSTAGKEFDVNLIILAKHAHGIAFSAPVMPCLLGIYTVNVTL